MDSALEWLHQLTPIELLWADKYLRKSNVQLGLEMGNRDDLRSCITYLQQSPDGRELVGKMRNAAAQKRFRERNKDKHASRVPIRRDMRALLNRLAKKDGRSISVKLEELITNAHNQEFGEREEMKAFKAKANQLIAEKTKNEIQAMKAVNRVQGRLEKALKELSIKMACSNGLEGADLATESEMIYKKLLLDNEDMYMKLARPKRT